jgi:hypothetical protein
VPSAFASEASKPSLTARLEGFFYKKLQYHGSVNQAKRYEEQPVPESLDILKSGPSGGTPEQEEAGPDEIQVG